MNAALFLVCAYLTVGALYGLAHVASGKKGDKTGRLITFFIIAVLWPWHLFMSSWNLQLIIWTILFVGLSTMAAFSHFNPDLLQELADTRNRLVDLEYSIRNEIRPVYAEDRLDAKDRAGYVAYIEEVIKELEMIESQKIEIQELLANLKESDFLRPVVRPRSR